MSTTRDGRKLTEENFDEILQEMVDEFNANLEAMSYEELVECFQPVFTYRDENGNEVHTSGREIIQ